MQENALGNKLIADDAHANLGRIITEYNNILQHLAGTPFDSHRWHFLWEKKSYQEELIRLHKLDERLHGWVKTCFSGTHIPVLEGRKIVLYPSPL